MLDPAQAYAITHVLVLSMMYILALENHILRQRLKSEGKPAERPRL